MWSHSRGSEGWPLLKMAMFEEEGVGLIVPGASNVCRTAEISRRSMAPGRASTQKGQPSVT
jgi:hypothetical protein